MKVYRSSAEARGQLTAPAVAIGNFDGVHLGHQELFARATALARQAGGEAVALTFDPHPARFFNPELCPPLITREQRKLELMERAGLDAVVVEPFNADLASLSPREFAERVLAHQLGARNVVVGEGFIFGRKRAGNLEALRRLGEELGFVAHGVVPVRAESIVVSSTKIRNFLFTGKVCGAATLLGREYELSGEVVKGKGRGRQIGIPTANVAGDAEILPKRGVYAGRAMLPGGGLKDAVINIGTNPTFEKAAVLSFEVHILDFSEDLYGQELGVRFTRRLRDEKKFSSVDELLEAIRQDIEAAREILAA